MSTPAPSSFDRALARLTRWLKQEQGGVTMNDAADRLGLSRIRIAQLTDSGLLVSKKLEIILILSRRSVEAYAEIIAAKPKRKRPPGRPRKPRPKHARWAASFLTALRRGKSILDAARTAGVTRQTVYALRARDESFAVAWDAALSVRPRKAALPGRAPARRGS